jgi:hypothetical protein
MRYVRALLSAFTIFGGHFLNRRLDRVAQFCGALMLVGLGYFALSALGARATTGGAILGNSHAGIATLIILALAITSALVTWFDAATVEERKLSPATCTAGVIMSFFGLLLTGLSLLPLLLAQRVVVSDSSHVRRSASGGHDVHGFVHFGGQGRGSDLPAPPEGPHALRGRITINGAPLRDAHLSVILNEEFEADSLRTDANGETELRLAEGVWFLNQLSVNGRHPAASGRLTPITGLEPRRGDGLYSKFDYNRRGGLEVRLPSALEQAAFTVDLRNAIATEWPPQSDVFQIMEDDEQATMADVNSSVIRWQAVRAAVEYEVQINRLEKSERGFTSSSIAVRRLDATELPLVSLPQRAGDPSATERYSVEIYAFDADGRLLTETGSGPTDVVFQLSGATQLDDGHTSTYSASVSSESQSTYFRDMERLSLVSSLIDYKQLDAAKAILDEVSDNGPRGRKPALQAAIAALSGDCATALPLFAKAEHEGGVGCVAPKYRALCAK